MEDVGMRLKKNPWCCWECEVVPIEVLFLAFLNIFPNDELLAQRLTPNLEDQVIYDQGFLPLAFDKSMSSCKAADAT